jgi:hypothetical protein
MKVKSIKGTRSTATVLFEDNKAIVLTGELTTEPKFYADISSIKKWEPPFENDLITEEIKKDIIKSVEDHSKTAEVKVVFD